MTLTTERVKKEIQERFANWVQGKEAEVKSVPIGDIDWNRVISDSVWRNLPFTLDPKNPKNEKGFRDCLILETVCSVCKFYSPDVNIAFLCGDYALREAAEKRLGHNESFSVYESIRDFLSFIELTRKDLTERFVKSILSKAALKFFDKKAAEGLILSDGFIEKLREEFKAEIEQPTNLDLPLSFFDFGKAPWKHVGSEQTWITRAQFESLEGENIFHWNSKITFARLYEREASNLPGLSSPSERRLMVLNVDVHWKSSVTADGRFFDCSLVDHKKADYSFEAPSDQQLERYGIQKSDEQSASASSPATPPATGGS